MQNPSNPHRKIPDAQTENCHMPPHLRRTVPPNNALTPSTIASFGTPSTRKAFGTDNVRLLRYTVKDNVKQKINNFVARYGNKYNNYATINLRSYKGYIKFISPNLDSKIDNIYLNKIQEIFERGVYIE